MASPTQGKASEGMGLQSGSGKTKGRGNGEEERRKADHGNPSQLVETDHARPGKAASWEPMRPDPEDILRASNTTNNQPKTGGQATLAKQPQPGRKRSSHLGPIKDHDQQQLTCVDTANDNGRDQKRKSRSRWQGQSNRNNNAPKIITALLARR